MYVNTFFTIFIVIYLWCGVILYEALKLNLTDEILVLILVFYTIGYRLKSKKKLNKEIKIFSCIAFFYLFYSLCIRVTSTKAVILDFQQQIKPYMAFYCTSYLAPRFTTKQWKGLHSYINFLIIATALIILCGLTEIFFNGFSAVLATTMLTLSLFHYYTGHNNNIAKKKSLLTMSLGLLSLKAKFFSEFVMAIYLFLFRKTKLKLTSLKTIISLAIFTILIICLIWEKLNFYYIEGFANSEGIARPLLYQSGIQILWDYFPFGSGLGTFCNDAARTIYSPLYYKYNLYTIYGLTPDNPTFATDCFYPTLSQFGIVGVFLFILFWYRRYNQIKTYANMKFYLIGYMSMIIIIFDAVADSSYLSNRGLGFFILLGLITKSYQPNYKK